jgi:hypothetical protein
MTNPSGKMGANRDTAGIGTWAEHKLEDDGRNIYIIDFSGSFVAQNWLMWKP